MSLRESPWSSLSLALIGAAALPATAQVARAEIYMSPDQAAQLLFPGEKLERREVELTSEQKAAIEKASDEDVRSRKLVAYVGATKNAVFIDQVVGKHEFITIAVGVAADGSVRGTEILEYRETYGYQVRHADWRKQFVGKRKGDPIKVGSDIKNISGATLSSVHVSDGVRRLVQTYDTVRAVL
jgi:Na+-translocating ferredoxin:NAD+ oxidoreductase RnfG subunit